MSSLRALRASFAFHDAVPLFTDAEFHLPAGWTGLVGPNGAGKTTLLRILSGELKPTGGAVSYDPQRPLVALCPQEVGPLTPDVEALAASWEPDAHRLRAALALDPEELSRWPTLSPGERKRWQVAAAVGASPDLLLLDEPSNHLDAGGREWLLRALSRFRGVGLLVSHDRALLDALTRQTLRLDRGELGLWPGPYTQARDAWEVARAGKEAEFAQAKDAHRRAEARLHQSRVAQAATARNLSAGARMKGPKDSDARALGADIRVQQAEKRIGRQVAVQRREAEKLAARVGSFEFEKEVGRSVFVDYQPAPRPILAHLDRAHIVPPGLLEPVTCTLNRGERIHLAGPNGSGKTTLLHALLDAAALPPDRVLYLPQEIAADEGPSLLARVRALPHEVRGRVLSLVAALGVDPERLLCSASPSPGEARKLSIAEGLGRHAWALALDEPTNHLDLPSVERLEAALHAWPGALLLVTHDAQLADRTCRTRWTIEGGALRIETIPAA